MESFYWTKKLLTYLWTITQKSARDIYLVDYSMFEDIRLSIFYLDVHWTVSCHVQLSRTCLEKITFKQLTARDHLHNCIYQVFNLSFFVTQVRISKGTTGQWAQITGRYTTLLCFNNKRKRYDLWTTNPGEKQAVFIFCIFVFFTNSELSKQINQWNNLTNR